MKRRINSTGRKNISLDKIAIRLHENGSGGARTLTANLTKLTELSLDTNARVYVESYIKAASMRFSFGTIGALSVPADTRLTEVDSGGALLFRVIIVDETGEVGRIIAAANGIHPIDDTDEENDERSILSLCSRDLGEAVWEVVIGNAIRPSLVVNNRIPLLMDNLKKDPLLQGAIIPHAIRVIIRAAMAEDVDEELEWVKSWRKFAYFYLGEEIGEGLDQEDLDDRIEKVVKKFMSDKKFVTRVVATTSLSARVDYE